VAQAGLEQTRRWGAAPLGKPCSRRRRAAWGMKEVVRGLKEDASEGRTGLEVAPGGRTGLEGGHTGGPRLAERGDQRAPFGKILREKKGLRAGDREKKNELFFY
jgi:imidazolonepropionase-like amidohydrolase